MKKNQMIGWLLCLALIVSLLTGCGGSSESMDRYQINGAVAETWASSESMKEDAGAPGAITGDTTLDAYSDPNAKLIRTVWLDAQTQEYDAVITALDAKIRELGGYVENREAYNGSAYYGRSSRYCNMVIRIPAERLDEFVTHVNENCNVTNTNENVENITLEYADTAARVASLEVERDRLMELLEGANNLTEILEIEARLSDVRYELESYASQLRIMDNMVSYATIHLDLNEVEKLTPVEEPTVWERISSGFTDSVEDVWEALVDLFVWVTVNSPWLVIWGIFLTGVAAGVRVVRRRKPKGKKAIPQQPEQKEE